MPPDGGRANLGLILAAPRNASKAGMRGPNFARDVWRRPPPSMSAPNGRAHAKARSRRMDVLRLLRAGLSRMGNVALNLADLASQRDRHRIT